MQDLNRLLGNSIQATSKLIERIYNAGPEFGSEVVSRLLDLQKEYQQCLEI